MCQVIFTLKGLKVKLCRCIVLMQDTYETVGWTFCLEVSLKAPARKSFGACNAEPWPR